MSTPTPGDCITDGTTCLTTADISVAGLPTPGLTNTGYHVFFALVILICLSGLTVVARTWVRIRTRQMGPDDYAILIALTSCITQMTMWGMAVRYGYGADYLRLQEWNRREFNKWWFLGAIFYPVTVCSYKTSVILLNKRIFVQKKFQIASWIILVINICWALGNTLGWIFQCIPVPSMWGDAEAEVCFNMDGEWISLVTWNVFTDIAVLTMPLPMVWGLSLKTRDKIMLSGVFILGACVSVFSILSCSAIADSLEAGHGDNQLNFALANLCQVLESNMGIIASCLPVLRAPLQAMFPSIFGTLRGSNRHYEAYEDRYKSGYALQNVSLQSKASAARQPWRNDESHFDNTSSKKSDEVTIIGGNDREYNNGGAQGDEESARPYHYPGRGIRKTMEVSVER